MTELFPPPSVSSTRRQRQGEFELLGALAGVDLPSQRMERIANWTFSTLDWSKCLQLAEHHGVLPLAGRNLIELGRGASGQAERNRSLPLEVERSLRSAYEANLRRNLWFTAELARIMQHFESSRLLALPYKWAALGESLYPHPGLGSFSDLHFLTPPSPSHLSSQALSHID